MDVDYLYDGNLNFSAISGCLPTDIEWVDPAASRATLLNR